MKLPMFKFDPLRSSQLSAADDSLGQQQQPMPQEGGPDTPINRSNSNRASSPGQPIPLSLSRKLDSQREVRTDVNDKASFLEPPPGKFRREFSNDHPLAKGGTGRYTKELKKGVTPAGMHLEVPEHLKNSKVSDTVEVAGKIERLTYTAQRRVVDPKSQIDAVKREQNATLKRIVMEERDAEAVREQTLRSLADQQERHNLEAVRKMRFSAFCIDESRIDFDCVVQIYRQISTPLSCLNRAQYDLFFGAFSGVCRGAAPGQ